jgi:hypothetical protein
VVLYTLAKDGALFGWSLQQQQQQQQEQQQQQGAGHLCGVWVLSARHYFMQRGARLTAADFHKGRSLLVAGGCRQRGCMRTP